MEEKIKIRTAADARRKFRIQELTFDEIMEQLNTLHECNEDLVLMPAQRITPGVKDELERAGFGVHEFRDAFVPTRKITMITWIDGQPEISFERTVPVTEVGSIADCAWLDNAEQARALSKKYGDRLDHVLYNIQESARAGRMSVEIPDITGTELEQELHDRGFRIRHFMADTGMHSEISW